ncbi:MAG TPA: hypothetical protein VFR81_26865 [Longimicrobium sp.]|nr:hypothetical protein [Longimicrobium sp.]
MTTPATASQIRKRVQERGDAASDYVSRLDREGTVWTILTLAGGGLSALMTTILFPVVGDDAIPIAAGVLSFVSVFAAGMQKARVEARVSQLQAFAGRMEGLAALLDSGRIPDDEAVERYESCMGECPPIPPRSLPIEAARGTIDAPAAHQVLPEHFVASGTAEQVGRHVHLWLTLDIGDWIWPKNGRVYLDAGRWEQRVHDPSASGFGLTLWAVTAEADRRLRHWLEEGTRRRNFPGLPPLTGMSELAHVGGLRRGGNRGGVTETAARPTMAPAPNR